MIPPYSVTLVSHNLGKISYPHAVYMWYNLSMDPYLQSDILTGLELRVFRAESYDSAEKHQDWSWKLYVIQNSRIFQICNPIWRRTSELRVTRHVAYLQFFLPAGNISQDSTLKLCDQKELKPTNTALKRTFLGDRFKHPPSLLQISQCLLGHLEHRYHITIIM